MWSRRAVVSYWRNYVHEVLVNRLGGLSLPRKSVVRLTDRPDMTLDVYRGCKTTMQQQQQLGVDCSIECKMIIQVSYRYKALHLDFNTVELTIRELSPGFLSFYYKLRFVIVNKAISLAPYQYTPTSTRHSLVIFRTG